MTREDFGFVTARALSILAVLQTLRTLFATGGTIVSWRGAGGRNLPPDTFPLVSLTLPVSIFSAFLAWWLWVNAPTFGRWQGRTDSAPSLFQPRQILNPLLAAASFYYLVDTIPAFVTAWFVNREPLDDFTRLNRIAYGTTLTLAAVVFIFTLFPTILRTFLNPAADEDERA